MSTDKRWTYNQITAAEKTIAHGLKFADQNAGNYQLQGIYRSEARGAYDLWYATTVGWQNDGDSTRLKTLIDSHLDKEREAANRS